MSLKRSRSTVRSATPPSIRRDRRIARWSTWLRTTHAARKTGQGIDEGQALGLVERLPHGLVSIAQEPPETHQLPDRAELPVETRQPRPTRPVEPLLDDVARPGFERPEHVALAVAPCERRNLDAARHPPKRRTRGGARTRRGTPRPRGRPPGAGSRRATGPRPNRPRGAIGSRSPRAPAGRTRAPTRRRKRGAGGRPRPHPRAAWRRS